MKQDYFIYNEKIYKSGTILKVKQYSYTCRPCEENAIFISCNPEKNRYEIQIRGCTYYYPQKIFYDMLIDVTNDTKEIYRQQFPRNTIQKNKKHSLRDELSIDSLLIAWIWYIFIMSISVIFVDCIVVWVCASIIFFAYRNKKLREVGLRK
jgi:hypothetical protein